MLVPRNSWLYPDEHPEVVARLLDLGLLKLDNGRNLPLKSGGTTDVYINLREARRSANAITYVTGLLERPVRFLKSDQFVEVPDAVSCFAGPLAQSLGTGFVTVREQAKEGRVADAKIIGELKRGQNVCIVDDVITNGASKIVPIRTCRQHGVDPTALVVLVDRQQGWQQEFEAAGITTPVWAGMTLHDVRRELILSGEMRRCDPDRESGNPIIVALDNKNWDDLLPLLDRLRPSGSILKVNDLLFAKGMDFLIPQLHVYGRVMADLKCHDIPNTVGNTCRRLAKHNVWAVTVHAGGSREMVKAAVEELKGTDTKVLAVTVLTSIDADTCEEIYRRRPWGQVRKLAKMAMEAGAHGFVCSTKEVRKLRQLFPKATLVVPGVRSPGVKADDQKRVGTPACSVEDGADHLVMGRQILGSPDPVAEIHRVISDEINLTPRRMSIEMD